MRCRFEDAYGHVSGIELLTHAYIRPVARTDPQRSFQQEQELAEHHHATCYASDKHYWSPVARRSLELVGQRHVDDEPQDVHLTLFPCTPNLLALADPEGPVEEQGAIVDRDLLLCDGAKDDDEATKSSPSSSSTSLHQNERIE